MIQKWTLQASMFRLPSLFILSFYLLCSFASLFTLFFFLHQGKQLHRSRLHAPKSVSAFAHQLWHRDADHHRCAGRSVFRGGGASDGVWVPQERQRGHPPVSLLAWRGCVCAWRRSFPLFPPLLLQTQEIRACCKGCSELRDDGAAVEKQRGERKRRKDRNIKNINKIR